MSTIKKKILTPRGQSPHLPTNEFYFSILNSIADYIFVKDRLHRWVIVNDEFCKLIGYPREFLLGKTDTDLFPLQEAAIFWNMDEEVFRSGIENINTEEITSGSGQKMVVTTKKTLYTDGNNNQYIVGISRDVTAQKQMEKKFQKTMEKLEEISLIDDLTKLYNRRGFTTLAEQQMKLADRQGFPVSLLFVDLNNMKEINDLYGHPEGDIAIKNSAQILQASFRKSDIIGRIGGDEFVVLAVASGPEHLTTLREHIYSNTQKFNENTKKEYQISMAVGAVAYKPQENKNIFELMHDADKEMYLEKQNLKKASQKLLARKKQAK